MKKVFILLLTAFAISACGGANGERVSSDGLKRLVDEEAGVVCWYILNNGGIDCMPIEETKLDGELDVPE